MCDNPTIKNMYQLNAEIQTAKKICIFGTGINAVYTFSLLAESNIYADFFADRAPQCEKVKMLLNRPVINEDELVKLECVIIIASVAWKEIADRLQKKNIYNIFVAPIVSDKKNWVTTDENYLLSVGGIEFDKNIMYVCCPRGLGDTLYVAALAKEYKKTYPEIKRICFIVKENHKGVVLLFKSVDEIIISNEIVEALYKYSLEKKIWRKRNYIYGHFTSDWLREYDLGLKKGNMVSFYKEYIMRLEEKCELERPQFKSICPNIRNINKNAIIFMPYAESSEMLPGFFWERMSERLMGMGYEVYTNVKNEAEKPVVGTKKVSETVEVMAQLCEKSLAVVSLRSGMCDLLALTNSVLLIVNTEEAHFKFWNVKFTAERENIFNFNYYIDHDIDNLGNEILKRIEGI